MQLRVPIGVSNRHIHISRGDFDFLFGQNSQLTVDRPLSQPGQFAAKERLDLIGPKDTLTGVRILGPFRSTTQVELSRSDSKKLGLMPPVRDSGHLENSAGIVLMGPSGSIDLTSGAIIAQRHIHMTVADARAFAVSDKDLVDVRACSKSESTDSSAVRDVIFTNVLIRVSDQYRLDFHLDTDEANAAGVSTGDYAEIIRKNPKGGKSDKPPYGRVLHGQIRTLITEDEIHRAADQHRIIVIDRRSIVTPSARNLGKRLGVIKD